MSKRTESCGRCGVTAVLDAVERDEADGERAGRNPFDGERIELSTEEARRVSFVAARLGRLKRRLDETGFAAIYRR